MSVSRHYSEVTLLQTLGVFGVGPRCRPPGHQRP